MDNSNNSNNTIQDEKNSINKLRDEIASHKSNHEYEECIKLIQDNINKITEKYSKNSKEYYSIAQEVCDICNIMAQEDFINNNYEEGIQYLEKCVSLFQNYKPILNVCYNNLGHYYRKLGITDKALESYDSSIKISGELKNKKNVAEGHINYSIVLISINKVNLALEQSLAGIILLQECLLDKRAISSRSTTKNNQSQENQSVNDDEIEEYLDIYSMLENSYILVAICHFKLSNTLESLLYYEMADKVRSHIIGESNEGNGKNKENTHNDVLSDEAKLKMYKECLNEIIKDSKKATDKNEKMANNYMKNQINKMIKEIEDKNGWSDSPILEDKAYEQMDQISRFQAMCKKMNNNN